MQTSDRGLLALIRHEGVVPGPYLDVKDVWTFGIGHTAIAGSPDPARLPRGMPANLDAGIREAFRIFRTDLATYEAEVLRTVKVPLEPHEFDALVSFHYNTGGIAKAALTHHLNAGNRAAAAAAFMGWLKPPAIRSRREAERDIFARGLYSTGTIPVWSVDRNGRVDFSRPIRRLSEAEALALLRPLLNPPSNPMSPAPSTAATDPAPVQAAASLTARILAFLKTLIGA
ncbi:lysozyme [Paracoccus sp. 08]|uniref:lysozyme n=1 Tax=Paracoccus sp. 08 TaxID=2606624 RepID=UPI00209468F1|nr:lysozyme [Paracoccus sp. 08]MCO6362521.1 glycoside hydrolase family protein [Paracoccus sp. 08]